MRSDEDRDTNDIIVSLCIGTTFLVLGILFYPEPDDTFYRKNVFRSIGLVLIGLALFVFAARTMMKGRKRVGNTVRESRLATATRPTDTCFADARQATNMTLSAIEASGTIGDQFGKRVSYIPRPSRAPTGTSELGFAIVGRTTLFSAKLGALLIMGGRILEGGGCQQLKCLFHPAWLGMELCPSISSPENIAHVSFYLGDFKPLSRSADSITYLLRPMTDSPRHLPQLGEEGAIQFPNGLKYSVPDIVSDVLPLLMALDSWDEWVPEPQRLVFAIPPFEMASRV